MRRCADILLYVMFVAIALTVIILLLCAFSRFEITLLVNQQMTSEFQKNLVQYNPKTKALVELQIERMKAVQNELFDRNTISLIFQIVTLALVTIGAMALKRMLESEKASEKAAKLARQGVYENQRELKHIVVGGNSASLVAVKYNCLHQLLDKVVANPREASFQVQMRDIFVDIQETVEKAVSNKHGFEPYLLRRVILDLANNIDRGLDELLKRERKSRRNTTGIADVRDRSRDSLEKLKQSTNSLIEFYRQQWKRLDMDET